MWRNTTSLKLHLLFLVVLISQLHADKTMHPCIPYEDNLVFDKSQAPIQFIYIQPT